MRVPGQERRIFKQISVVLMLFEVSEQGACH